MDYSQNFSASYQLPLNLIPIFDWINTDASYSATYNWQRGTDLEDGTSLGNNISNNRQFNLNGSFSLEKLYNHIPFLKKTNERFNKNPQRNNSSRNNRNTNAQNDSKNAKDQGKQNDKEQAALPKNKKGFEKEITLLPDTTITVSHGKNSKKLVVSAKNEQGRTFPIKYKVVDQNNIRITTKVDSSMKLKLTVIPKEPHDDEAWYKTAQVVARGLMMLRNVSFSYRNTYSMALPGFLPSIGNMLGQRTAISTRRQPTTGCSWPTISLILQAPISRRMCSSE